MREKSFMRSKRIRLVGIVSALAALIHAFWILTPNQQGPIHKETALPESKAIKTEFEAGNPVSSGARKVVKEFKSSFTMERLSDEHDRRPTAEEWRELTRILLFAKPCDLVEAVKARFSVHAEAGELNALVEAYENPVNDDTRQRIIEIFSTLQSSDFPETARRILNDENRTITDDLLCASALSLVRTGQMQDIQSIFHRINSAGEDPETEGSLYSDADGLMYAISEARSPELEQLLISAVTGRGLALTGRARYAAAAALGNYPSVAVTEVLYELSKNETNAQVRKQAKRSLEAIQTPE
jgi:hypothetical protein